MDHYAHRELATDRRRARHRPLPGDPELCADRNGLCCTHINGDVYGNVNRNADAHVKAHGNGHADTNIHNTPPNADSDAYGNRYSKSITFSDEIKNTVSNVCFYRSAHAHGDGHDG